MIDIIEHSRLNSAKAKIIRSAVNLSSRKYYSVLISLLGKLVNLRPTRIT